MNEQLIFLDHEKLAQIRQLRKNSELDRAERILLNGEPTPLYLMSYGKSRVRESKTCKTT